MGSESAPPTSSPLEPAVRPARRWPPRYLAGLICVALGIVSVAIAAVLVLRHDRLFSEMPDWRVTVPFWVAAAVAAAASGIRREGRQGYGLAVAGVALASAALALGWVLVLGIVGAVTLIIIYVMSELL